MGFGVLYTLVVLPGHKFKIKPSIRRGIDSGSGRRKYAKLHSIINLFILSYVLCSVVHFDEGVKLTEKQKVKLVFFDGRVDLTTQMQRCIFDFGQSRFNALSFSVQNILSTGH